MDKFMSELFASREPSVETVCPDTYNEEKLTYGDDFIIIESLHGSSVNGDREVHLDLRNFNLTLLKGEEAIRLGQALISQGLTALEHHRIYNQAIKERDRYMMFQREGRVEKVIFRHLDGEEEDVWRIYPIWISNRAPQGQEDFCFDIRIEWVTMSDEFKEQIDYWAHGLPFEIVSG